MLKLSYSLQFCAIPSRPFVGIRETNFSMLEKIDFFRQWKYKISCENRESGDHQCYSMYFLVSKNVGVFRSVLERRLNTHVTNYMLTIK